MISRYWALYGSFDALIRSGYLWAAFLITLALFPLWVEPRWWDLSISILPNLLGFSLGGYAMLIGFGDEQFRQLISGPEPDGAPSPYLEVNAAFVHFIVLQMIALIVSLSATAYHDFVPAFYALAIEFKVPSKLIYCGLLIASFFGCWIFIYALSTALAATLSILRVASWYDGFLATSQDRDKRSLNTPLPHQDEACHASQNNVDYQ